MGSYLLLAVVWMAWCFFHSFLISPPAERFLKNGFGKGYRYARAGYNLVALATLAPVLVVSESLRGEPVFAWSGSFRMVQGGLLLVAVLLFAAGGRRYDFLQFAGIRQARGQNDCSVLTDDCTLDTGGVLGIVRHPWYSGGILLIWARNLDAAALTTNTVLTLYFVVGAVLEERKLVARFGEAYLEYQRNVSMLVPVKWIRRKLFHS